VDLRKLARGSDCHVIGCDRPGQVKGMCDLHYRRVLRYGNPHTVLPRNKSPPLRDRLAIGARRSESGCLEWMRGLWTDGYGQIKVNGRPRRVPRVAWELAYGAIPEGMLVCHHCDNPLCIEPSHLFLGTPRDNRRDCIVKGRANACAGARHWNYSHGGYVGRKAKSRANG